MSEADLRKMVFQKRGTEYIFSKELERAEVWEEAVYAFYKMQGCGNDYIYVNAMEERVESPGRLAKAVSDRHFGIGADGLILIGASKTADFSMEMYNADGSKGAMCGNGIRCVGKYVYEHGLTRKTTLTIETGSGNRVIHLQTGRIRIRSVR